VHINGRLGQVAGDDPGKTLVQRGAHLRAERQAFVLHQVPVGKQRQLAAQQRLIVRWQNTGTRRQLPADQCVHRLQVQGQVGWRLARIEHLHHGLVTQIGQQHKTLRLVPGQYLGHQQAGLLHQRSHLDKGFAVLAIRRRVHDDARTWRTVDAEIASEAGVCAGQPKRVRDQLVARGELAQPVVEQALARRVGPDDGESLGCGGLAHG